MTSLEDDVLNVTLVQLDLTTQNAAQVTQQRSFNVIANRWLPDLKNGVQDLVQTQTIQDALLYTLVTQGHYDINNIDVTELSAIQADLDAIDLSQGSFNGIVDQTMPVEDQTQLIANVGRIQVFRRASTIYFNRLKAGLLPITLINARNKISPETLTMNFGEDNDNTSIILRYLDEDDSYNETTTQYPDPDTDPTANLNPSSQSIIGVTSGTAAARIAQYLWDKRINERDIIEVSCTEDAVLFAPGDVVAVTDHLRSEEPLDGEVIAVQGTVYTLDRIIPAGSYRARLRSVNGDTMLYDGTVTVADGDGSNVINIIEFPADPTMPVQGSQVGLLYSFIPINDSEYELFYISEIDPDRDGAVRVSGFNYRDDVYAGDSDPTPIRIRAKKVRGL